MRRKIIAGNWKMNKTPQEAVALINELKPLLEKAEAEVVFCPPMVSLSAALEAVKGTNIGIGAQNMYFEESGAFTGEVAPKMLVEMGVKYVILGHSERRQYFAETDESVNKKVLKALEHNLVPIVCVGETLEQREQGITEDLVRLQTKIALQGVCEKRVKEVVIAYEPVWAIGTGRTASNEQAEEVCAAIRKVLTELYGEVAEEIRIQYGGSVKPDNAREIFAMPNIDGGLVGGASLTKDFAGIVLSEK
ncbi:triose-phosphate isomerase [Clostridiales bacterium COT073_COT-073]|nr:triose-phosphate isomerase [Clostridiales bacterium COT073_COT-073]